jgi:hypothetical protein
VGQKEVRSNFAETLDVERTFAGLLKYRRHSKNDERKPHSSAVINPYRYD